LRLAAWDFEVLYDTDTLENPLNFASVPSWRTPPEDVFWFHGFLIVVHSAADTIDEAILKAKAFIEKDPSTMKAVRMILIFLRHIALAEISPRSIKCSALIPLILNTSAMHTSPGFRILASVLSSSSWKMSWAHRESWGFNLPTEIFDAVLQSLPSKDLVNFARASFQVEKWYYSSIPHFNNIKLRSFDFSMPCCGK
jgi:hypothetical protein